MSRLASVSDYQNEISAVQAMIAEEERLAQELGRTLSSDLVLDNLRARLRDLEREFQALGDEGLPGHEMTLTVRGQPVVQHQIEAEFLGRILQDVQRLVRAVVAGLYDDLRRKGPWEPEVLRRSTLRFTESFAGSFGMTLEAVDEQMELEGHLAIQPAFQGILDVLTSHPDTPAFLENLGTLTPRARSHLRRLLRDIAEGGAEVDFSWPVVAGRKEARVSAQRASAIVQTLDRIEEDERLEDIVGVLEGAILRTAFFEIQRDDGEVIGGRVAPQLQKKIAPHFGKRVKATVIVTTVHDKGTDETRMSYRLVELEPIRDA